MNIDDLEIWIKKDGCWESEDTTEKLYNLIGGSPEKVFIGANAVVFENNDLIMEINHCFNRKQIIEILIEISRFREIGVQEGKLLKIKEIKAALGCT